MMKLSLLIVAFVCAAAVQATTYDCPVLFVNGVWNVVNPTTVELHEEVTSVTIVDSYFNVMSYTPMGASVAVGTALPYIVVDDAAIDTIYWTFNWNDDTTALPVSAAATEVSWTNTFSSFIDDWASKVDGVLSANPNFGAGYTYKNNADTYGWEIREVEPTWVAAECNWVGLQLAQCDSNVELTPVVQGVEAFPTFGPTMDNISPNPYGFTTQYGVVTGATTTLNYQEVDETTPPAVLSISVNGAVPAIAEIAGYVGCAAPVAPALFTVNAAIFHGKCGAAVPGSLAEFNANAQTPAVTLSAEWIDMGFATPGMVMNSLNASGTLVPAFAMIVACLLGLFLA